MDTILVKDYYAQFGQRYLAPDIFRHYPETKIIPAYILQHFGGAQRVLDLGFGTGVWFWASFLHSLERLDGIDCDREALDEADRVFGLGDVPAGFRIAHELAGSHFDLADLVRLAATRGNFVFQDYRRPWPATITRNRYDLVTEHGGGFGQMDSDAEVIDAVAKVARVLEPGGRFLFVNFVMAHSALEEEVGKAPAPGFCLRRELLEEAVGRAGLRMADFHTVERPADMPKVETFFYGYAQTAGTGLRSGPLTATMMA